MLNFGGFLSSNFWTNYRCQSSASIEDLLNSKNCTVDKLLDDDDCLQELKNFNDKLIKYFDHDKLKVLIDYITVMPNAEDGHDRGHKYPFIAGEIFNCEINQILDKFFEAPVKIAPVAADDDDKDSDKKSDTDKEEEVKIADPQEKGSTTSDSKVHPEEEFSINADEEPGERAAFVESNPNEEEKEAQETPAADSETTAESEAAEPVKTPQESENTQEPEAEN